MTSIRPDLKVSRHGQMAEAFEIFALGMGPFIDEQMHEYFADEVSWTEAAANRLGRPAEHGATDPLFQLLVLRRFWGPVFSDTFTTDLRRLVEQLIEARNLWAHFSLPDDTSYLESILLAIERILAPVEPDSASDLRKIRARLKNPTSGRQHRLSQMEQELLEAAGRSEVLETYLRNERLTRSRMEWLFVGFIAAMLLVMVLLAT